jgi:hypothetical protein
LRISRFPGWNETTATPSDGSGLVQIFTPSIVFSPFSSACVSSRDRFSITGRPILVWSVSASPNAIMVGSSRCPKPSNVRDTPTRPG